MEADFINDTELFDLISKEEERELEQIELIASENFTSKAVQKATGSVLTNKYAEGYPGKRYYGGCEFVDKIENLAIERVKKLFGCNFANVQPHSGSSANLGVYFAFLNPGDTILGLDLFGGGHLTHGHKVSISGKWFNAKHYGVDPETHLLDYDAILKIARETKPKIIIAGASAYPRTINFKKFREIADEVGALLMADVAHYAGLIVAGLYENPFPHAHIVTSTTHKTLRGPRSGIILTNDETLAQKIDAAVMPGIQGGPLMHIIAGKAVCFHEALQPEFKTYANNVLSNAKHFAEKLTELGFDISTNGTDCHLLLVDLRKLNIGGKEFCDILESVHITCNKNAIPYDPMPPWKPSGIRLGTPAMTTRDFGKNEFEQIAHWIRDAYDYKDDATKLEQIKSKVVALCRAHPLP